VVRNILERQVAILKYKTENTSTHLGIVIQNQNSSTSFREQSCFWKQGVDIDHFSKKGGGGHIRTLQESFLWTEEPKMEIN
jgi:hypothetical protein